MARPVDSSAIPDKPFFKIGEAARLVAVKPYVLRFWEGEFRSVKPQKTRSQQRLYRRRDVELLLRIRELLYDRRFTIEGARQALRGLGQDEAPPPPLPPPSVDPELLRRLKRHLEELVALAESGPG